MAYKITEQTPDRPVGVEIDVHPCSVDQAFTGVQPQHLADQKLAPGPKASAACCRHSSAKGASARRGTVTSIDGNVGKPVAAHLAVAGGKIDRAIVHRCRQRLVHQMDHELSVAADVACGVLGGEIGLVLQAEDDERRIFGEHIEEAERRRVDDTVLVNVVTSAIGRGTTTPHNNL